MKLTWLVLSILAMGMVCLGGSTMNSALQAATPKCNVQRIARLCSGATASAVLVVAGANALERPAVELARRSMWDE